jgi:serine phosphatase RsbU (regulator of sigma subunit)/anti-sigma regulatory factor (Ser/Thr protein kinase)
MPGRQSVPDEEPPISERDGSREPWTVQRDSVLADALRTVVRDLEATTALAYLVDGDGRHLRPAVIGGSPPTIFALPDRVAVTDPYSAAAAFREGRPALESQPGSSGAEVSAKEVPFPCSAAAVPLGTAERRFGALMVVWAPPRRTPLPPECQRRLSAVGARVGRTLARLADRGCVMLPGIRPTLVPIFRAKTDMIEGPGGQTVWGLADVPGSTGLTFMYHVHKLAAALNKATGVQSVVQAAHSWMMAPFGAQAIVVSTFGDGRSWVAGHSGYPAEAVKALHGCVIDDRSPYTAVMMTGAPLFFGTRSALLAAYPDAVEDGFQAWAYLPIKASGRHVGACAIAFGASRGFTAEEQAVAMMMANLLGQALERERLGENENRLAESLQKRLLPRALTEVPGIVTTARYVPASGGAGVGGAWYDVITLPGGQVGLVVGDVENHGIDGVVAMGQVRSAVRAYATEGHAPSSVLARTDQLLSEMDTDLLTNCCFIRLDVASGTAEIALAGHPPPLLRRPDGTTLLPDLQRGGPLGVRSPTGYQATEVALEPGTLLVLYTDGLASPSGDGPADEAHALLVDAADAVSAFPEDLADRITHSAMRDRTSQEDVVLLLARYEGAVPGPHRRISHTYVDRHDLQGVGYARKWVCEHLRRWGLDMLNDELELMTSEVVTNALIHADSDVDLRLREYPDRVRLEARDADPRPPIPSPIMISGEAGTHSEHGRGLLIVDALATQWGTSHSGRGKIVWLEVPVPS